MKHIWLLPLDSTQSEIPVQDKNKFMARDWSHPHHQPPCSPPQHDGRLASLLALADAQHFYDSVSPIIPPNLTSFRKPTLTTWNWSWLPLPSSHFSVCQLL